MRQGVFCTFHKWSDVGLGKEQTFGHFLTKGVLKDRVQ